MASGRERVEPGRRHATTEDGAWLRERCWLTAQESLRIADRGSTRKLTKGAQSAKQACAARSRSCFRRM